MVGPEPLGLVRLRHHSEETSTTRQPPCQPITASTQPSLWQDKVQLDNGFWKSLQSHPVPVREEAIRAIGPRSMAIDVYIWLAYRLHSLTKTTPITWPAVHAQFGASFKAIRQMKPVVPHRSEGPGVQCPETDECKPSPPAPANPCRLMPGFGMGTPRQCVAACLARLSRPRGSILQPSRERLRSCQPRPIDTTRFSVIMQQQCL
jgi:hypothetical protein